VVGSSSEHHGPNEAKIKPGSLTWLLLPAMQMDMHAIEMGIEILDRRPQAAYASLGCWFHCFFRVAVRCRTKGMGLEALQSARSPDERYQAYDPYTQRNRVKPYVPVPGMRKKALVPEQLAIVESDYRRKHSNKTCFWIR